jgi:hypothetical protein
MISPPVKKSYSATNNARNVALMIEMAFEKYRSTHTEDEVSAIYPYTLTPYMNYVSVDTTSIVDDASPPFGTADCSTCFCLRLHDGGTLWIQNLTCTFNNNPLSALRFQYDPDSKNSSLTGLAMLLYRDGKMLTRGTGRPGTVTCGTPASLDPTYDPTWFTGF